MEKIISIESVNSTIKEDNWDVDVAGFVVKTDKQIISLWIDDEAQCCENWGYFMSHDNFDDFLGAELIDVKLTDSALNEGKWEVEGVDPNDKYFHGGIMFVNLETSKGVLQFVAYNDHNGYYSHRAIVACTQLSHSEYL